MNSSQSVFGFCSAGAGVSAGVEVCAHAGARLPSAITQAVTSPVLALKSGLPFLGVEDYLPSSDRLSWRTLIRGSG